MADQEKAKLPSQGERTPRDRREGGIVPAPSSSSSCKGLSRGSKASPLEAETIAINKAAAAAGLNDNSSSPAPPQKRRKLDWVLVKEAVPEEDTSDVEEDEAFCQEVNEERIVFDDGEVLRWKEAMVSPIFDWVFIKRGGQEEWCRYTVERLERCLGELPYGMLLKDNKMALKHLKLEARDNADQRWISGLRYLHAAVGELWCRLRELMEMVVELREAREADISSSSDSPSLEGSERARRPKRVDVGVQTSAPLPRRGASPIEVDDPLGGAVGQIMSRLDALERNMGEWAAQRLSVGDASRPVAAPCSLPDAGGVGPGGGGVAGPARMKSLGPVVAAPVGVPLPAVPGKGATKKKKGKKKGKAGGSSAGASAPAKAKPVPKIPAPPRSAAVVVTVPAGGEMTYAAALASARKEISLEETGVSPPRMRRARTGGLIMEIPGPDGAAGADRLARRLVEVLGPKGVRVVRPSKLAELRVRGLDDSVTPEDVAAAVAAAGGCEAGEVSVGAVRRSPANIGAVWLRCPAVAAAKLAALGKVRVGWALATIEPLEARPQRCHRCLEVGHLQAQCASTTDRRDRCYRCGRGGHTARGCSADPRCPLCSDGDGAAGHQLGGVGCRPRLPPPVRDGESSSSLPVGPSRDLAEPAHRKEERRKGDTAGEVVEVERGADLLPSTAEEEMDTSPPSPSPVLPPGSSGRPAAGRTARP